MSIEIDKVSEKYKKYLEDIPIELRITVSRLRDYKRWAVYNALFKKGKMSFSEIKDLFEDDPEETERVLKDLKAARLISKFVERVEDLGDREKTYYEVTEFGKDFYNTFTDLYKL